MQKMKNWQATVCGIVAGAIINLGLVTVGMSVFPLPEGIDASNMDEIRKLMPTLPVGNFVFPLLGHAIGSLIGATVTARLAANSPMRGALIVGGFFLLGGIAMIINCSGPTWFISTDLLLCYFPMALLGGTLGMKLRPPA